MTGSTDGRMSADDWSRYIQWALKMFKGDEDVKTKTKTADPPVGQSLPAGEAIRMSGALNVTAPKTLAGTWAAGGDADDSRYRVIAEGSCLSFEAAGFDAKEFSIASSLWTGYLVRIDWIFGEVRSARVWRRPNESTCWTLGMKAESITISWPASDAGLAIVQAEMTVLRPTGPVQIKMAINKSYRSCQADASGSSI